MLYPAFNMAEDAPSSPYQIESHLLIIAGLIASLILYQEEYCRGMNRHDGHLSGIVCTYNVFIMEDLSSRYLSTRQMTLNSELTAGHFVNIIGHRIS